MLTVESLKELGADTDSGLGRCLNNEEFYLKLVKMALDDANFAKLRTAVEEGNLDQAFESAHAMKGMLGNVSLDNILKPVQEMTELLRARKEVDYLPYLNEMEEELKKVRAL